VEDRKFELGVHADSITFEVMNPKLWWCNGMGEQPLYDFSFEIKRGVRLIEKADVRTGIRTVKLVTEKDKDGESFYFLLNDKRVFAKGANYIPQDLFQDRVAPGQYQKLLDDVKASNMNMLRVWGGGIYEDDMFYQLCDARGILVWQDFMYACALYPSNGRFLKTAAFEALEQIERLRQHPCIALWCGNNENNEAWNNWGWQMKFTEDQRNQLWRDYKTLFQDLLPIYVETNGGGVSYWESSPRYGRANPKSHKEGDSHYWGVWHDEEPFDVLNKKVPRFMSEFGFQSFPEWKTIETFTLPEDRKLESKVMLAHQKHPRGNALIAEYLQRDYRPVDKFEDLVYVSQLLQAEGMRTGIEAHRRNKPYCMGTLYWQLNDVWGGASWASRDYLGRWKALQYYVREAYKPVAVLPYVQDDILKVYGVSDLPDSVIVHLRVRAMNLDGKVFNEINQPDTLLLADSSKVLWEEPLKKFLEKHKPENTMIECQLIGADSIVLSHRLLFLTAPKNLKLSNPRISTTVSKQPQGYEITLTCESLAKNVFLQSSADGFFSDNYFDLIPGERKTVLFTTKADLKEPNAAFTVKHLLDTWK
jgi:beta-mannosidase